VTDPTQFDQLLARLDRTEDVLRLASGDATSFAAAPVGRAELADFIANCTATQRHVWFEINATSYAKPAGRSSARDITRLNALYVDIDFKDTGMGSIPAAEQLIAELSAALGVPPAAIVSTGNGLQPYWPISDAFITDADSRTAVSTIAARFKVLADRLAAANGGVVDSLFDLPRIFRVPGSVNWKDLEHPKPVTADFPDGWAPFTVAELTEVFDDWGIDAQPREIGTDPVIEWADVDWATHDCDFVGTIRHEITQQQVTARHPWMLARAAQLHGMVRYGCLTERSYGELRALLEARHEDLCRSQTPVREPQPHEYAAAMHWGAEQASRWSNAKLIDEMRSHTHADFTEMFLGGAREVIPVEPDPAATLPDAPVISIFSKQPVATPGLDVSPRAAGSLALQIDPQAQQRLIFSAHTDSGNAELFAQSIAGRFLNVAGIGWHMWDGARWALDAAGTHREALKDLFTQRLAASQDVEEKKWLQQSLNSARMTATLKWAETIPAVLALPHQMDADPYELVTPGGIFDLRTRIFRQASPLTDRNTKITGVAPDWTRPAPRWQALLDWAFQHEPAMIRYVQRVFGIALIGELVVQHFPVFLGSGGEGKSQMADVALGVLGGYGMKLGQQFLVQTRSDQHPEQIAQLRGVRLAIASEVPRNAKFNEELVKALTGDGTTRARLLYENSSEFPTTASLMALFNHLPGLTAGGPAWWRRFRRIDMPNPVPEERQVEGLARMIIAEEGPQVLAWMLDGTADYLAHGEQVPDSVRAANQRYRIEEDALARYVDTRLVMEGDMATARTSVYQDYQQWANMNRIFPILSEPKFARELLTIHPELQRAGDEQFFWGVRQAIVPSPFPTYGGQYVGQYS
jgi:P4 family phage/plasmid primase-like protien